jgi:hypothetical protein
MADNTTTASLMVDKTTTALAALPKYLVEKKAAMPTAKVVAPTTGELNPVTLLGNPSRMFPVLLTHALNLDAAFAAGIPDGIPYPWAEYAGPYDPAHYAADYQAYLDFTGIVTPIVNYMASNNGQKPPAQYCQDQATYSGDSFLYGGKIYNPGVWSPF